MRVFKVLPVAVAFAALLQPTAAVSQELTGYGALLGIHRGNISGGFANLVKDVGGEVNARTGFTVGGFADFALRPNVDLRAEGSLTQKGTRIPGENGVRRRDIDMGYFDVSGIVRRSFAQSAQSQQNTIQPWIGGGAVLSLNTSEGGVIGSTTIDGADEVKSLDLGLALEAGARRGPFDASLRYVLGLPNVSKSSDADEAVKNRGVRLVVSYDLSVRRGS